MASPLTRAGTQLNTRLPESPNLKNPALQNEFQGIHNAVHILANYLDAIRDSLESQPGQIPSESLRFRYTFWSTALQDIVVGAVCSSNGTGIVNGVQSNELTVASIEDSAVTLGSTGNRDLFDLKLTEFYIALTAAKAGELVQLGVGPGVLSVTGATCGGVIWAADSRTVNTSRGANQTAQIVQGRDLANNGGLYLQNAIGEYRFGPSPLALVYKWEGYWVDGYPSHSGSTYNYHRVFLYPVGICISDGFVLFDGYKRTDPPRKVKPAGTPD